MKLGGVLCVWPIINISIGAAYLEDCPLQHYIPIYLIVSGIFSVSLVVLSYLPCLHPDRENIPAAVKCLLPSWNLLTFFFLITWFLAGNAWVYSIYEPNYNKNTTSPDLYCNKTYLFAFCSLTIVYILLGLPILIGLILIFCGFLSWVIGAAFDAR